MTTCILDRNWDHPDGNSLRQAQQEELRLRYEDDAEPGPAPTSDNITVFIVAYIDDQPVGCGALRASPNNGSYPGDAELKRMFVMPEKRGKGSGVASTILRALEERARSRGWKTLVLESGTRQPDAIRFYTREGYTSIPKFGPYVDAEQSVCFERRI